MPHVADAMQTLERFVHKASEEAVSLIIDVVCFSVDKLHKPNRGVRKGLRGDCGANRTKEEDGDSD